MARCGTAPADLLIFSSSSYQESLTAHLPGLPPWCQPVLCCVADCVVALDHGLTPAG